VERALVVFTLDHCAAGRNVILEEECVYLPLYYNAEVKVAAILGRRLRAGGCAAGRFDDAEFGAWLARHAHRTGWQADPAQADACRKALQNPVFILTGGPGTGKTTTLQVIVSFLREHKVTIALAAPTGRAAQRMGNVAGFQAQTLHRLLEYRPDGDGFVFGRNAANPLEAGVVIVDEVSMVDLLLMRSLLEALPDGAALILVGDSNQLPSVGAGNVLADLIASRAIVHVELTTIFRQAVRSRIVTAAHQIIRGDAPSFANGKDDNCFFLTVETPQECLDTVIDLVCTRLPARYGFHPVRDIQVLTPMHRGILGTQNINALLQARLNPAGDRMERGETVFAAGDKVMQARNNYDQGVFNGDIGYIDVIDEERRVRVDYEGKTVWYEPKDLEQIVHAYCISIHKSQGCEFRAAVIPVMTQHYIMLQRNLIYTALTRARELCVFAGTYRALRVAVDNPGSLYRFSRLARRLVSPSRPDAAK